ncbi:MAG: AzlC family ABC transporter permease [Propionibacteriaceae bacterium]|jgi:predicted branched-subunit amino acid permease|nr:AzlC family ABC transporter permease [Propionibacteriaceae bacterium]
MGRRPSGGGRSGSAEAAIRQAVSVSLATGLYGVSFGALAVAAGLSLSQTVFLSAVMFTGGSQFALIGVIGSGGLGSAAVAGAALLGSRNGLYGVQLGPALELKGWRRWLGAHLTIDESTAVALAQPDRGARRIGFWWAGAGVWLCWNGFTVLGALAGQTMGQPTAWGLDAAAGAAFLGLLWPRLTDRRTLLGTVLAMAVALLLIPLAPAGLPVLAAGAVGLVLGWLGFGGESGDRPADPSVGGPPGSSVGVSPDAAGDGRPVSAGDDRSTSAGDGRSVSAGDGVDGRAGFSGGGRAGAAVSGSSNPSVGGLVEPVPGADDSIARGPST